MATVPEAAIDISRENPALATEVLAGRIETAANWLADNWHVAPQPITRTLRESFGLNFNDACKAMAQARRIVLASRDR